MIQLRRQIHRSLIRCTNISSGRKEEHKFVGDAQLKVECVGDRLNVHMQNFLIKPQTSLKIILCRPLPWQLGGAKP
jgi:hypothetical protein